MTGAPRSAGTSARVPCSAPRSAGSGWTSPSPTPVHRADPARAVPEGVDLQSRVPGELLGWRRTTTGEWVGWVCVPISQGEEVRYVYQYVAAAALSPREDLRDRR